ncbi:MAG: SDR family oxidoreductase [Solirubrobacterales bacterium]
MSPATPFKGINTTRPLAGQTHLVLGAIDPKSIGYRIAWRLQQQGATVALTAEPRRLGRTLRFAKDLPVPLGTEAVFPLDVNEPISREVVAAIAEHCGGALESIIDTVAFAPMVALGDDLLNQDPEELAKALEMAVSTSATSVFRVVTAMLPLLKEGKHPSVLGLTFGDGRVWPGYGGMGVAKAALEAAFRQLALELALHGIRANTVLAGPLQTPASGAIPGFKQILDAVAKLPFAWDSADADVVADACLAVLSPAFRGMTGEVVRVQGLLGVMGTTGQ